MPTANEAIQQLQIRHAVGLQRYSAHVVREVIRILETSDREIVAKLRARGATLEGTFTSERFKTLLEAVREINQAAHVELANRLRPELRELAKYEATFQAQMIQRALPVAVDIVTPSAVLLNAVVTSKPFEGRLLREWVAELSAGKMKRLRDALRLGMVQGETTEQIVRRIAGTRAANYRDGILEISRRGARAMIQTATNHVANSAREEMFKENESLIKKVQWVATLDTRTCPTCAALDGETFDIDDGPRPPRHINCLPGHSLITTSGRITAASKRWFNGNLIVARTAAGHEFSCTPNHPILTVDGWRPAQALNLGSKVVRDLRRHRPSFTYGNHQDVPTRIEDVAKAFLGNGEVVSAPMPTAAEDFHGDGMAGEVAVVGAYRDLGLERYSARRQSPQNLNLQWGLPREACFVCGGSLGEGVFADLAAANSIVGGFGELLATAGARVLHAIEHGLASVSWHAASFAYGALDRTTRDAETLCDLLHAQTGAVVADDLVAIERRVFRGHVYNLETEDHLILAEGGIVTHNCRCTTIPVTKSWRELGIDLDEAPEGTRASMNGQVPGKLSYGQWLKGQSAEVQDEALGKTRGALFRRGGLTVDRFVDTRGNHLTLDELREAESAAFRKANL